MGNVSDKLPSTPPSSPTMDSSSGPPQFLGSSPGEASLSLEWFDAPESLSSPSRSVMVALKVVNGGVESHWNGETKIECPNQQAPLSPFVKPAILLGLESRCPTSRFRISSSSKISPKKRSLIARLSPYEKKLFFKKVEIVERHREKPSDMPSDEKEEEEEHFEEQTKNEENEKEQEDDVDLESHPDEGSVTGFCPPPTPLFVTPDVLSDIPSNVLLESPSPPSSPTPPNEEAPPTDADMKRQKKKNRKKARQLNKEQQLKRDRLQRQEANKKREERIERERQELEAAAAVAKTTEQEDTDTAKKVYNFGELPREIKGMVELEEDVTDEKRTETFEVCVDGERKRLREFTPRSKQDSMSYEGSQSSSSSNLIYGMPEHEPVVVPFNESPMVVNYNFHQPPPPPPNMAPMYRPGPPPPPYPNPPPMPQQFVAGPPPRFLMPPVYMQPAPPPPPPPQQFHAVGLVPIVPMQRVPMRVMPMVNHQRPPMYMPPPPNQGVPMPQHHHQRPIVQGPPPPQQMGPPPQPSNTVYASRRQLVRPTRNPLPITAPPEKKKQEKPKQSSSKEGTSETRAELVKEEPEKVEDIAPPVEDMEQPVVEEIHVEEISDVSLDSDLLEDTIVAQDIHVVVAPQPIELRRGSSVDFNGDLITSGVAAVLEDSDEELPPIPSTSTAPPPRPLSPDSLAQLEAINRVLDFSKESKNPTFDIWSGWMNDMPSPTMPYQLDGNFKTMLEQDEKAVLVEKKAREKSGDLTLMSICKSLEHYFMNSRAHWAGATLDGDQLRQMFKDAYGGSIPSSHWRILEKVCQFEQGYFHVFDVLIGSILELTYKYLSPPEEKRKRCNDELYKLYYSFSPVDGVENFFNRFEEIIMPDLLYFLSNRYVSIRAFVAIAEVVKETDLTASDLYYLATLVYGAKQFTKKFNARIKQLHILEACGKRWIRQTTMDEPRGSSSSSSSSGAVITNNEPPIASIPDFMSGLRPFMHDILEVLPDGVIKDFEFFRIVKLVCGWHGDGEERIWKSIIKDRSKLNEFCDAYKSLFRFELRMDRVYLQKWTSVDDCGAETDEKPLKVIAAPIRKALISSMKTDDERKNKKKSVSYPDRWNLVAPEGQSNKSTQTDHVDMDQIWDLERRVIRQLKRDNIPFNEFLESDNAREMHQFLIDTFKEMDLRYFAFILEKAMAETHEKSWKETVELRNAAEEARSLLEESREQHKQEFGELRSRLETISRFEAYEVQVASNSRIDKLKERINQLNEDRELLLREEVKEERARMQRQLKEMKEKHNEEKRQYAVEMARLKEENARLLTDLKELAELKSERVEMAARCESQMIKAKEMCATSTRLLQDSRREIMALRDRQKTIEAQIPTPDPEWDSETEPEQYPDDFNFVDPSIPSTSSRPSISPPSQQIQLSSDARLQLKILEKYSAEFRNLKLRETARELVEWYNSTKANHKERKTAEKQLKEYEKILDSIENAISENLEMLKLNVVDGLLVISDVPIPFSDKVMQKMLEYKGNDPKQAGQDLITDDEDGCLICTEVVEAECETVTCDTCTKEYHYHCISQWLKINSVCPACSRTLKDPNEYPRLGH